MRETLGFKDKGASELPRTVQARSFQQGAHGLGVAAKRLIGERPRSLGTDGGGGSPRLEAIGVVGSARTVATVPPPLDRRPQRGSADSTRVPGSGLTTRARAL